MTFRTITARTSGCPAGQSCFVWYTGNSIEGNSALTPPTGWRISPPCVMSAGEYTCCYFAARIDVPKLAAPGVYSLGEGKPTVTVAPPTDWSQAIAVASGTTSSKVSLAAAACKPLTLKPGLYEWTTPVTLPPGAHIRAYGAVIRSTAKQLFNSPAGGFEVEGGEWYQNYQSPEGWQNGMIATRWPRPTGNLFRFYSCYFHGVSQSEFTGGGAWYDQCTFDNAQCFLDVGDVVTDCYFTGGRTFPIFNYSGGCLIAGCTFRDTQRGIILQSGNITDAMIVGNRFQGVGGHVANGGECILFEGGSATNCVAHCNSFMGCTGPDYSIFWPKTSHNNIKIQTSYSDTPATSVAVATDSNPSATISDLIFENMETAGQWDINGPAVKNVQVINGRFRITPRSAFNQVGGYPELGYYRGGTIHCHPGTPTEVDPSIFKFIGCSKHLAGKEPIAVNSVSDLLGA